MSPQHAQIISMAANAVSAFASIIAAVLWWLSANVTIPDPGQFPIGVVRPDTGPLGQPLGGTYVGSGYSKELQSWATTVSSAFASQSKRSGWAARSAAVAAIAFVIASVFQTVSFLAGQS
jgi:hypothetical protein